MSPHLPEEIRRTEAEFASLRERENAPAPVTQKSLEPKNVPPAKFDSDALYKPDPHLPDIVRIQRKGTGEAIWNRRVKMVVKQFGDAGVEG